ncbi:MAG: hypothetical protein Q4E50_00270 [Tissierellia bacterium]|nr:hypothetical protein [Tissierellia bacterium]
MKNIRKVLALLLALTMVFALAACGKDNKPSTSAENSGENSGEKATITYLLLGSGKDMTEVEAKINERLDELKANYNVKLLMYGWDNYAEKLGLAARGSGDKFDLATTASWLGPYATLVNDQGFADITDLLDKNAPELKKSLSEEQLKGVSIDGKIYGIPTTIDRVPMARDHFIWNINELEKIGKKPEDVDKLDTVESLEPILKEYKEKFPEKYPLDGGSEWAVRRVDNLIKTNEDGSALIENIFAADYMKTAFETAKKYADAKYIHPEAGVDGSTFKQDDPDTWLVKRGEGEPGALGDWTAAYKTPIHTVFTAEDIYIGNANVQGKITAVYNHSENKEEAVNFIEKIATDEVIQNLLAWGIEGKHYTLKDGKAIPDAKKDEGWAGWGNQFVSNEKRHPNENQYKPEDPALKERIDAHLKDLKPGADLGFNPSQDLVEKLNQINEVKNTYYPELSRGRGDYAAFLQALKDANVDSVVEELQTEYDAWKAQK